MSGSSHSPVTRAALLCAPACCCCRCCWWIRAIAATRMRGAVVAVLEVVVRHAEAVADAALDRLHRRAVTVLAQVMVAFAGPHQRLDNFAFHQPAARRHGREPERGLVEAFVALASRRRGELGLNPIERRHRIGAATIVAGLGLVRLAGFLTLRRAQHGGEPLRQWRRVLDRRASRHRSPAAAVRQACARADNETAGAAHVDPGGSEPRPLPSASPFGCLKYKCRPPLGVFTSGT